MAVLFIDGFDHYLQSSSIQGSPSYLELPFKWTGALARGINDPTFFQVGPSFARGTGGGLWTGNINSGTGGLYKAIGVNSTTPIFGAAVFSPQSITSGSWPLMGFMDSTTLQVTVSVSAGKIVVYRGGTGGTLLATSTNTLSSNTWYYMEFKCTINSTTGVIEVRVNGSNTGWIPSTGSLNTQSTGNAFGNALLLGSFDNSQTFWDDLYYADTTGSTNTNFLGPCRIAPLLPVAAGNYSQWTPNGGTNFANVDDMPDPDSDVTFNQSSTAGQIDSFLATDVPATSGSVFAVQHNLFARQDTGVQRTIAPLIRRSSTDYPGTSVNTSSSYTYYSQVQETDPSTSSAWGIAGVNAAEFGYKLIS